MDQALEIINVENLYKFYIKKKNAAVNNVSFKVHKGEILGLIGPDGAGKTSIIQILAGVLKASKGNASVAGVDVIKKPEKVKAIIGYMPQGLGINLYETLSVDENINFFKNLKGIEDKTFYENKEKLLTMTRLGDFKDRLAKQLSGGMRQKLALVCTLISLPDIILLDEPTTGVDPISRRDFWQIIHNLLHERHITVLLTTSYMDEAERCHKTALINEGSFIAIDTPENLKKSLNGYFYELSLDKSVKAYKILKKDSKTISIQSFGNNLKINSSIEKKLFLKKLQDQSIDFAHLEEYEPSLEEVFLQLTKSDDKKEITIDTKVLEINSEKNENIIECKGVTIKFGNFIAVNNVTFNVESGEIFGLLGPNGAGKTTLIKMMCGLLSPTYGNINVIGYNIKDDRPRVWKNIGYMSQRFSLYQNLTVMENINLYAGLYSVRKKNYDNLLEPLGLLNYKKSFTKELPLGIRQRLSLTCAFLHNPPLLFLDEPTSGVDPSARQTFWEIIYYLSRNSNITIIVTTHYMAEAERCDRLGLMHQGFLLNIGSPQELKKISEDRSGKLVSIEVEDFRGLYDIISKENQQTFLYGNKIQLRTKNVEATIKTIKEIIKHQNIVNFKVYEQPLSMEETFIDFIMGSNTGNA